MPSRFGRYELLERISVGGMAEVFRGRVSGAAGFEKIVAIKRILPQFSDDGDFIRMFIDEAKISANLNHSNIGQVFEFGRIEDRYFIAMEFIHGKDLRRIQTHFRSTGEFIPIPMAVRIVLEVCNALEYAHSKRDATGQLLHIVHRDVSPQNVLISFEGAVKLIDFGIAKALSRSNRTATGNLKGKFDYMAPEQVEGEEVDHRSDLFSLGAVLWELLAGQALFRGDNELATLEAVRQADVPVPSSINPAVPPNLDSIVGRALARVRDDRYQRAEELHEALERFAQTHRMTFTTKQLSRWMKAAFGAEIPRQAPLQALASTTDRPVPPSEMATTPGTPLRKPARATLQGFNAPGMATPAPAPRRSATPAPIPRAAPTPEPREERETLERGPRGMQPAPAPGQARPAPGGVGNLRAAVLGPPRKRPPATTPLGGSGAPTPGRAASSAGLRPGAALGAAPVLDDDKPTKAMLRDDLPDFGAVPLEDTRVSEESAALASQMDPGAEVVVSVPMPASLAPEPVLGKSTAAEVDDQADTLIQEEFERAQGAAGKGALRGLASPVAAPPRPATVPPRPAVAPRRSDAVIFPDGPPVSAPVAAQLSTAPTALHEVDGPRPGADPSTSPYNPQGLRLPAGTNLAAFSDDGPTIVEPGALESPVQAVSGSVRPSELEAELHVPLPGSPAARLMPIELSSTDDTSQATDPFSRGQPQPPRPHEMSFEIEDGDMPSGVELRPAGAPAPTGGLVATESDALFTSQPAESVSGFVPGVEVKRKRGWLLPVILVLAIVLLGGGAAAVYVFVVAPRLAQDLPPGKTLAAVDQKKKDEPKPKVEEPKPKTVEPKPKTVEPKPKVEEPKPKTVEPKPKVEEPRPKTVEPKPKVEEPRPKTVEPKPKVVEPKPKVVEPKPKVKEPKPKVKEPKPKVKEPKPKVKEPKPKVKLPKPKVKLPKPKVKEPLAPKPGKSGFLLVSSKPWAKISVDGKPTGRNTPTPPSQPLVLSPGPHKITLEAGGQKFTFSVVVAPGETAKLIKTLSVTP